MLDERLCKSRFARPWQADQDEQYLGLWLRSASMICITLSFKVELTDFAPLAALSASCCSPCMTALRSVLTLQQKPVVVSVVPS